MLDRTQLRKEMRGRRRALGPAQRTKAGQRVAAAMTDSHWFRNSRHIAFYLPNDGELDLRPLLGHAEAMGKTCYLPVLSIPFHNHLWFMPYRSGARLQRNRFGIPEPAIANQAQARKPWTLDLLLAPLVAFDARGNRLGMGGGFYDRTLAFLRCREHWHKPRVVGTAYAFQEVDALPAQPWDVPLDAIVTEDGLRYLDLRG